MILTTRKLHLAAIRKLRQRYVGHFQVFQRVGQCAYKLDLEGRFVGVHDVFHVSQLRPHVPGGTSATPPDPVEVDGEAQYEVECLLKPVMFNGKPRAGNFWEMPVSRETGGKSLSLGNSRVTGIPVAREIPVLREIPVFSRP